MQKDFACFVPINFLAFKAPRKGHGGNLSKEQLAAALNVVDIEIKKIDPSKKKPVFLGTESASGITVEAFGLQLRNAIELGDHELDHMDIYKIAKHAAKLEAILIAYAREHKIIRGPKDRIVPEDFDKYVLNVDMGSDPIKFFVTKNDVMSKMSGAFYLTAMGLKHEDAILQARHTHLIYDPRGDKGMSEVKGRAEQLSVFNTYVPPLWVGYKCKSGDPVIPELIRKVIKHVLPSKDERTYFYAWMYMSVFKRAPTYLVLNGDPGIGKNRLKLLMRALHGYDNTPDGKKSSLTERFNSQVERTTLLWFDELRYDERMENILKEMQNETMSIEKKGIDATRSTKIYASMVISNNYPRDNYIQFDARKFAPLDLNPKRLETSMSTEEIDTFTKMFEFEDSDTFDVEALAQFARWLKRYGPSYVKKYKNMEYKGPRFWFLAHTSMSKWQMAIIQYFYVEKKSFAPDIMKKDGFLWSQIETLVKRKMGRGYQWPHIETIRRFLQIYHGLDGKQGFQITPLGGLESDFYVKPLLKKVVMPKEEDKEFLDL